MQRFIGSWDVKIKSLMINEEGPWEFFEEDGKLTGTLFILGNTESLGEITINGDEFSSNPIVSSPVGNLKVKLKGKIDGTHISGVADGGLMKLKFEGNKK